LSLFDHQLKVVMNAASMLPPSRRSPFLRSIGGRLGDSQ
jgi:hypothetical protein